MICDVKKGSIYYEVVGVGFPIVILHAMGTDHRSMIVWLESIFKHTTGFQRIYVDLPAHGRSTIADSLNSTDDIHNNLLDFLDQTLPSQTFSLIGHSYGGYLAQGILNARREQVKSICLLAPAIHVKERHLPKKFIFEKDEALLETMDSDIRTAFETLMIFQNKTNLEIFINEIQPGRFLANREFLTSDWREKGYYFLEEPFHNVEKLTQPALFILGKQDHICGYEDHQFLFKKFSNSTIATLDRAGHMLQIDKRELVQGLIKDWLMNGLRC